MCNDCRMSNIALSESSVVASHETTRWSLDQLCYQNNKTRFV